MASPHVIEEVSFAAVLGLAVLTWEIRDQGPVFLDGFDLVDLADVTAQESPPDSLEAVPAAPVINRLSFLVFPRLGGGGRFAPVTLLHVLAQ